MHYLPCFFVLYRLTKYQLLLKDLTTSSNVVCGKTDLEEALSELLSVIKVVNDSMHSVTIKGNYEKQGESRE